MKSVQDILDDLNRNASPPPAQEKTASENSNGTVDEAKTALHQSVEELLGGSQKEATANGENGADPSASEYLTKIANDLAEADEVATIKEARLYGAAVFDGFLSRANQYAAGSEKTASAQQEAATIDQIKQAAATGYSAMDYALNALQGEPATQKHATHQKTAQEEYNEGVLAGLNKVAEHAIDCFERGFEHMDAIAQSLDS